MIEAAYYNENDPYCYAWLENLIKKKVIMQGDVDGRSIEDVPPVDVKAYRQAHFFAGIGVWSHALLKAKYRPATPQERLWTGSCPCQPFSAAGQGKGFADERHLWPSWFWLIDQGRPELLFGEQVAHGGAKAWLDLVQNDLEGVGYTTGAVSVGACGFGGPHIRQRTYWVAHSGCKRWLGRPQAERSTVEAQGKRHQSDADAQCSGILGGLAHSDHAERRPKQQGHEYHGNEERQEAHGKPGARREVYRPSSATDFWRSCDWVYCTDGKFRPAKPGIEPLAHGASQRVGRLRGYGNAVVAPVAIEFIKAALTCRP